MPCISQVNLEEKVNSEQKLRFQLACLGLGSNSQRTDRFWVVYLFSLLLGEIAPHGDGNNGTFLIGML